MPRKITTVLYKFDELSEKAKKKALSKLRDKGWGDVETSSITEMFETDLQNHYALGTMKTCWSLGYCQGDGVAFSGTVDMESFTSKESESVNPGVSKFRGLVDHITAKIINDGRECHWNSMDVEIEETGEMPLPQHGYDWDPRLSDATVNEKTVSEFEEYLTERIKEISRELEKNAYSEIEYQNSDEVLSENAEANDLEFLEDGTLHR